MTTASTTASSGGSTSWFRRAEAWLDARGRGAWIVLMVLGFIIAGPLGLVMLAFMLITGKFKKSTYANTETAMFCRSRHQHAAFRSSGNSAFDSYKNETLKRLETEQEAFESFLQRLREAKDKQEFDRFMDERAHKAATPAQAE